MQVEKRQAFDIRSLIGSKDDGVEEKKHQSSKEDCSCRDATPLDVCRAKSYPRHNPDRRCCRDDDSRIHPKAIFRDSTTGSTFLKPLCYSEQPVFPTYHSVFPAPEGPCCLKNYGEWKQKYVPFSSPSKADLFQVNRSFQPCQRMFSIRPDMRDVRAYSMQPGGFMSKFTVPYPRHDLAAADHSGRRIRTTFTQSQLSVLEKRFKTSHYIVGDERRHLAQELCLNESQVKIWFQNRRTKYKQEKAFEQIGGGRAGRRKGEHHVKKWQIDTKLVNTTTS